MFETQTTVFQIDEMNQSRDWSLLSNKDEKRIGGSILADVGEYVEPSEAPNKKLIHIGQYVYLADDQFIGLITKVFISQNRQISHLAVRTARILGRHKIVPIAFVSDVTPVRVQLSISTEQFKDLNEYQSDSRLAEEADQAIWSDVVLRDTDYYQIDVQTRDGIISLNGHVITSMNKWRAETAMKNLPGSLGIKSYLIPDDKLTSLVAEALGQLEQGENCRFFSKVENGLAVLTGQVSSTLLRDQAEQRVAAIPWVRGVINDICVTGLVIDPGDQRFLQPLIGKELIFKDAFSATVQKVVINPHNRRVVAVVVMGHFPDPLRQEPVSDYRGESSPERLMVVPVHVILHLTRSSGFLRINSDETAEFEEYDPTRYITPGKNWLPPYPYGTDDVLFVVE